MGRRRRRVIRVVKRTLPKVFTCPRCGVISVRVIMKKDLPATVICGNCNLSSEFTTTPGREAIDIYNSFVDAFMSNRIGG